MQAHDLRTIGSAILSVQLKGDQRSILGESKCSAGGRAEVVVGGGPA